MYFISNCPVCSGVDFKEFGKAKDHTVSHETFTLQKCTQCEFLLTSPRPETNDLEKYYISDEYVSHSEKATTLFDKLYEISREFALNWKLTLVKKFIAPETHQVSLLDYGCGTGFFLKKMKETGFNIAGVEPSSRARKAAQKNTGTNMHETIETVHEHFDVITLWHVLEHVSNLNELIDQLKSRLNKKGVLFIAVPNHQSNDARKYGMHWAGYDVPRHLWHFEQKTMARILQKHNIKITATIPMKLDAYYVSMLSEKYKAGGQSILTFAKGLIAGLLSNLKAKQKNYSSIIYIARHA
ncbi:MAG TPA: class I SAM-dependent methyltransferase [Chryseosolibacter sp.]